MTKTETRILELFQTLAPNEQRALVEKLSEATQPQSFFSRLSTSSTGSQNAFGFSRE
jgi:hypothetical protein